VIGGKGDHSLSGDAGNDRLFSGLGDDEVTGGDGTDTFFAGLEQDGAPARTSSAATATPSRSRAARAPTRSPGPPAWPATT
jgi:hypothetical protein